MIKVYMPVALTMETQQVIKQHPIDGSSYAKLSDIELKELLERICGTPKENLPIVALTLSNRQNLALARYFPQNKFDKPEEKLAVVLGINMNQRIFQLLFEGWQNFPRNHNLLILLADHDKEAHRPQNFGVPMGKFAQWNAFWSAEDKYYQAIELFAIPNRQVGVLFSEQYAQSVLNVHAPLYLQCYTHYLSCCSMLDYQTEGDALISFAIKQERDTNTSERMILNLLEQGAKNYSDLIPFTQCYRVVFNHYGTPSRRKFPSEQSFCAYAWWYNYQMIVEGFNRDADKRRVDFWTQYLDRCTVIRMRKQQFLIMDFGKYYAVESEVVGTLYFFEKGYFESTVKTYLASHSSSDGKSWMKNYSHSAYEKAHRGYWQSEVPSIMRRLGMI